jgi:CheY-like chemotaxis protein
MTDARDAQPDGRAQLEQARVQFLETFAPRVQGLREALATLEQRPQSTRRRDNLLRRAHAMGAAARVLGFELVAEALTDVERRLRAATDRVGREQLRAVACTLDELPQLATGHPADGSGRTPGGLAPASAVVFGTEAFALALATDTRPKLEIARAEDLSTARDLAMAVAPDVAVVDADLPGAAEFIKALGQGTLLGAVPVVVTATIDTPDLASRFLQMGAARVLSKPVPPDTLYRAVAELLDRLPLPHSRQPLGRLTAEQLSERIADEVRRGLVNALEPGCEPLQAELGEGTDILAAVWGAVARVRELVTVRSQGAIRFSRT